MANKFSELTQPRKSLGLDVANSIIPISKNGETNHQNTCPKIRQFFAKFLKIFALFRYHKNRKNIRGCNELVSFHER